MFNSFAITVLLLSATLAFGCDANCTTCHPDLIKNGKMDQEHQILKRCTNCHKEDKEGSSHSACGEDCWDCHSIQKVSKIEIKEHKVLPRCINCHSKLKKGFDIFMDHNSDPFNKTTLFDALRRM